MPKRKSPNEESQSGGTKTSGGKRKRSSEVENLGLQEHSQDESSVKATADDGLKEQKLYHTKGNVASKKGKPLLVVLPGASGSLGKGMTLCFLSSLEMHFDVIVRDGKWQGWNPTGDKNVESVLQVCPSISVVSSGQLEDTEWYIMGNSFGNRVICAMCCENLFPIPPKGVVMCGYPMYGPKGTDERVKLLQELELSSNQRLLCISGAKDEFLLRGGAGGALAVFSSVVEGMSLSKSQVEVRVVEGGGHGVIDHSGKGAKEIAAAKVLEWMLTFFSL